MLMKLEFSGEIFDKKNPYTSTFINFCAVGAELFYEDGQMDTDRLTDITKLIVIFGNFTKEPKVNHKGPEFMDGLS
jgi:hypothetical protein